MPNNFDKLFNQAQGNELINALKGIKSSLDVNYPLETVNVTLSNNAQNITPSENYYGLGQVNVPGMNLSDMTILVNGNYDPVTGGLDGYGKLNVNVPTWGQADEGKVVSNNALVPQTNREVNANGTYDTTLNNSVLVNVPNTYGSEDEGKVVMNNALVPQTNRSITQNGTYDTTTNDEVVVNVAGGGSGSTTYTGKTDPSPSQGHIGDYYIKYAIFNELTAVTRSYQLEITKGLRGSEVLTYVGAQEIQLIYDDGNGNEVNIRTLADFTRSGRTGNGGTTNPADAFNGNTGGYYWEANPTTVIVNFSATVPTNYTLKKFVVWQRNSSSYNDVWADFDLIETIYTMSRTILSEKGLTVADWAGAGYGTEWDLSDISNPTEPFILDTYIKVGDTESTAEWIKTIIKFGNDKGMLVEPVYQGLGACYVDVTGTSLYTDTNKKQFLNLFEVEAGNTYALFVGKSVGARRRASFFSGKTFADFEYYINTPSASSGQLIYGNGIWLAPYTAGTDDSGSGLIGRIIYTPNTNGVIVYGTDNAGSETPAYCINLSKKVTQSKHHNAIHIVTHSTGGYDASLDVTEGYYDNGVFTSTGDTRTILYTQVQQAPVDYNVCAIDYGIHSSSQWSVKASRLVISDGVEYNVGEYLPSWNYDTQNEFIVYEKEATGAAILTTKTITQNGTYTATDDNADGYSEVVVNVSGGNIIQGTTAPTSAIGSDGNYYYKGKYKTDALGYTGNFSTGQSGQTKAGWEFTANDNFKLRGLAAIIGGNFTGALVLADASGNIIGQIDNVQFAAGVQTIEYFDNPISLTSGNNYIVQVWSPSGGLSYRQYPSPSEFDSRITYVRGRYGELPGNQENNTLYSANIIIEGDGLFRVEEEYYKSNGSWNQLY